MPSLDSIVRVTARITEAPTDATARFGGALIVTQNTDVLAAAGENKIGHYANLAAVANDGFSTSSEPYRAAVAYFGQTPAPPRLSIARWAKTAAPSEVVGSRTHATPAGVAGSATRLVSGSQPAAATELAVPATPAIVGIGGAALSTSPSTASGNTAVATIASDLQTAFRAQSFAGANGITVTLEGTGGDRRFVITVPAGVSIRAAGLTGNLATLLGFNAASDPRYEAPYTMSVGNAEATVNALLSAPTGGTLLNSASDIAAALQAALRAESAAGFSTLTVIYDSLNTRYEVSAADAAVLTAGEGALADAMGLSIDEGAEAHNGSSDEEDAGEFIDRVSAINNEWYWVILEGSGNNAGPDAVDAEAFSAAVQSTSKQIIIDVVSASPPTANAIAAEGRSRTSIIWSAAADYKSAALAGQFAARDLNRPNTAVTAKFRPLTGRAQDSLTPTQLASLDNQRINHYTQFGGSAILAEGVSANDGQFTETQHWVDWFTHEVQTEIYDLLRQSSRIPQTGEGLTLLTDRVEEVCVRGRENGGIAPGTLTASATNTVRSVTGNPDFNGRLGQGYLVHVNAITTLTATQRTAGEVPPIHVWLKGSGAVHFVDLDLTFGG